MKAIMMMFDSLNRHMLPCYGCDWVHAPNFQRLAEKTVIFDKSFVGSMPCMPARRELHTGRYNFLHRSWGPLEPFDDSMPEILKNNGILSHLVSDHYHYWQDGGCTYHTRYSNWRFSRGQEGDAWHGDTTLPENIANPNPERFDPDSEYRPYNPIKQDWINRSYMQEEEKTPLAKTCAMGLDFLQKNHAQDNWFLQIETFDPHEPYFVPKKYCDLYDYDYSKFTNDWPGYCRVNERHDLSEHYRYLNAALISMCDNYLGKVIDFMDEHNMWQDTMLIINTDHGFLLGEHDWWAKCAMPFYNEIAHTPLFVWDPRCEISNQRRQSLVQTIDLPATLLEYFNLPLPEDMQGKPLKQTIIDDSPIREAGLFGVHGGHVNCTDGHHVYMRAAANAENKPLYNYTLMPTHMATMFNLEELKTMERHDPLPFTKGVPVMKIDTPTAWGANALKEGTLLFDIDKDPKQLEPLEDEALEKVMTEHLIREMKANDAPAEQFVRLGLNDPE